MRGEGSVRWSVRNPLEIPTKGGKSLPCMFDSFVGFYEHLFISICFY